MQIKTRSIDHAAGGFLRHRFLRTLSGAILVLTVVAVMLFVMAAFGSLAVMQATGADTALEGLARLGGAVAIAAASAGAFAAAAFIVRPRLAAAWTAWRGDLAARRWRPVAIGAGAAVAVVAALAAATWGAITSGGTIGEAALFFVIFLAGGIIGVGVGVLIASILFALVQSLWRRLFGLLMLVVCGGLLGLAIVGLIANGFRITSSAGSAFSLNPFGSPLLMVAAVVAVAIGALVTLELFGQSIWQLTTTRMGFRAARGWRPPIHHLLASTRRHFGLPGFLAHFGRRRLRLTMLYFLVAFFNALILALAGAFLFAAAMLGQAKVLGLIGALVVLPAIAAAIYGSFRAGAHFARAAREETTKVYQTVRDWDARAPVVFLRNFEQDNAKIPARSIDPFLRMIAGVAPAQTLDEILLEHATPYGPVVAVGDPRTKTPQLGAARIFVEGDGNEWQGVVDGLCSASCAVVMCPTSSEGVRWELNLLTRHDLYKRTIYLANPEMPEAENRAIFDALVTGHELLVPKHKLPIAAFHDDEDGFRVLVARKRSTQTYTVALNIALQHLLGLKGVRPPPKPKKQKAPRGRKTPAPEAAAENPAPA